MRYVGGVDVRRAVLSGHPYNSKAPPSESQVRISELLATFHLLSPQFLYNGDCR